MSKWLDTLYEEMQDHHVQEIMINDVRSMLFVQGTAIIQKKSLFVESSPSPVKYAASLLNLCSEDVRLPLVKVTEQTKKVVKSALSYANLI